MSLMRYFDRLDNLWEQLETSLLLQEARYGADDSDIDDGSIEELRDRISELSVAISTLRSSAC